MRDIKQVEQCLINVIEYCKKQIVLAQANMQMGYHEKLSRITWLQENMQKAQRVHSNLRAEVLRKESA